MNGRERVWRRGDLAGQGPKSRETNGRVAYAVFLLVAATILLWIAPAGQTPEAFAIDVLKDVAVVIGSVSLLAALWSFVGGEPLSKEIGALRGLTLLTRNAHETGVTAIAARAGDLDAVWVEEIRGARKRIDLVGYSHHRLIYENEAARAALLDRLRHGVTVRIAILAGDLADDALQRVVTNPGSVRSVVSDVQTTLDEKIRAKLDPASRDRLQVVEVRDRTIFVAIRRFDSGMYVMPYLYARSSEDSPVLVVRGAETALFQAYVADVDALFATSS